MSAAEAEALEEEADMPLEELLKKYGYGGGGGGGAGGGGGGGVEEDSKEASDDEGAKEGDEDDEDLAEDKKVSFCWVLLWSFMQRDPKILVFDAICHPY